MTMGVGRRTGAAMLDWPLQSRGRGETDLAAAY
jgi:hypothetical protein